VFAIVSPLGTVTNLAVMGFLLAEQIPVVSPHSELSIWSTPLKLTYFALRPSSRVERRILAQYALGYVRPQRITVFAAEDQSGREGAGAFVEEPARSGGQPVTMVDQTVGGGRPQDWAAALADQEPDLVLLYADPKPAADLLPAARAVRVRPNWLGSYVLSGRSLFQFAGVEATHGLPAASWWSRVAGGQGLT